MYISYVAKARPSQLSIFTADCLRHPIQMAGVETIWELHTLSVIIQNLSLCSNLYQYCSTFKIRPEREIASKETPTLKLGLTPVINKTEQNWYVFAGLAC